MNDFTFTAKVSSLNLENDREYSQVVLKDVSFDFHEGSLDEINKAIRFEKDYIVKFQEMKTI